MRDQCYMTSDELKRDVDRKKRLVVAMERQIKRMNTNQWSYYCQTLTDIECMEWELEYRQSIGQTN